MQQLEPSSATPFLWMIDSGTIVPSWLGASTSSTTRSSKGG
jgi:hypothetical protein